MTPTLTFTCSICGEPSGDICIYCTKDACSNHICEKCHKCSDCCECEVRLEERSEVVAAVVAPLVAEASVNAGMEEAPAVVPVDGSAPLVEDAAPVPEETTPVPEKVEPVPAAPPQMPVFAEEPATPRVPSFTGLWAPETPGRVFPVAPKPPVEDSAEVEVTATDDELTTIEPTGESSVDTPVETGTSEQSGGIDELPGERRSEPIE